MSEANGKVCCNCRHCIRVEKERHNIECHCDIDNRYLGYLTVMSFWCRRWAKDKKWEVSDGKKKCNDCMYKNIEYTQEPCADCITGEHYEPYVKQTNADRIRSMSDEELAGFLDEFDSVSGCDMCSIRGNCHAESNCIEGFLGWLKSEVKE